MSIRRDKFPTRFDPETGEIIEWTEVERTEEQAEPGKAVAYFTTEGEGEDAVLLAGEDGTPIILESVVPDPREEQ